jgi:hypothetical protein
MSFGQGFPLGGGAPFQTLGNDFEINNKLYPGLILNPVSSESGGLYSAVREINGSQWILQNADINAAGFFQINPAFPSKAFVQLSGGGLAMYTAVAGSPPGFSWTRLFFVDNTGVLQSPIASPTASYFNVYNFGAIGNGIADDTAAIQATLNAAAVKAGSVVQMVGTFKISATLLIGNGSSAQVSTIHENLQIIGGGGAFTSITTNDTGTQVNWAGPSGGTMLKIQGPIRGLRMSGIIWNGAAIASVGIEEIATTYCAFNDVYVNSCIGNNWYMHVGMATFPPGFTGTANTVSYYNCGVTSAVTNCVGIMVGDPDSTLAGDVTYRAWFNCQVRLDGVSGGVALELRYTDGGSFFGGVMAAETPLLINPTVTNSGQFPSAYHFYNTEIVSTAPLALGVVVNESGTTWNPATSIGFWPWIEENSEAQYTRYPNHQGFRGYSDIGQPVGSQPSQWRITGDVAQQTQVTTTSSEVVLASTNPLTNNPTLYPRTLYNIGSGFRLRLAGNINAHASASLYTLKFYIGNTAPSIGSAVPGGSILLGLAQLLAPTTSNMDFYLDAEVCVDGTGTPAAQHTFASGLFAMGSGVAQAAGPVFAQTHSAATFDSTQAYKYVFVTITMPDALSSSFVTTLSLDVTHPRHASNHY